jgi:hypothetical protein
MSQTVFFSPETRQGLLDFASAQENPTTLPTDYAAARHLPQLIVAAAAPDNDETIASLRQANVEFRSDVEAYQSRIKSLMEDIARDRATITALTALAQREHSDSHPKSQGQSISDPAVFDCTRANPPPIPSPTAPESSGGLA